MPSVQPYTLPTIIRGTTMEAVQFTITENGNALDLTNATIEAVARWQRDSKKVRKFETTITNAAGGVFTLDEQIIDWDNGVWDYGIQFTLSNGDVKVYIEGTFTIKVNQVYG